MSDPVAYPDHYRAHPSGVECIEITKHFNFCLGNVIKYVWRADHKGNDVQDLRKAREYLDHEIARRELLTPRLTNSFNVTYVAAPGVVADLDIADVIRSHMPPGSARLNV